MSKIEPAKGEPGQDTVSFASALRDYLACGIIVIDGEKRLATITAEANRILNLEPRSRTAKSLDDLPRALQSVVREVLASGQTRSCLQIEVDGAGGKRTLIGLNATPTERGRKSSGAVLVVQDLSTTRRLEQTLRRIDRLASIGTMAASAAHEIKNALIPGKTFIDLLLEKHKDAELVDVVRREIGRIEAMVSRILGFARPDRPISAEVSLHQILEHSLRLVQPQRDEKGIGLNQRFQASPDVVQGDDYQLQQAFVNLFLNALEAMGPKGTLTVTTDATTLGTGSGRSGKSSGARQIRVTIADNGAGIPTEALEHLFDPFFTTKPNGTGLGLPITRRIIEEHRGAISVESQPGQGATFRIILAAARPS
jgi:signal transduction histidine kinase